MQKRILIAEDDADARDMLSVLLAAEGFSVITAEGGQQDTHIIENEYDRLLGARKPPVG